MRAAGYDRQTRGRYATARDGLAAPRFVFHEGAGTGGSGEQSPRRRRKHDPKHRGVPLDERDIHREFAVAIDELACAIQWIDEPESFRDHRNSSRGRGLLGDDLQARRDAGERRQDQRFGAVVGLGHRRRVAFAFDLELGGVDLHDDRAGRAGDRDDPVEQVEFR